MKREKSEENENWTKAYRQAERCGIKLTKRKNSQGHYVCYLSKKSRNLLSLLWDRKRKLSCRHCATGYKAAWITVIRTLRSKCCFTDGARRVITARTGWAMWSEEDGWVWRWRVILPIIAGICSCKALSKVFCEAGNLAIWHFCSTFVVGIGDQWLHCCATCIIVSIPPLPTERTSASVHRGPYNFGKIG